MSLDNRLQRKTIGLPSDTYEDDMSAEDKSPLNNLIGMGIGAAGVYGLYKKGLLKPIVKNFVEVAHSVASNTLDKSYLSTDAIKKWSNIDYLTPEKLEDLGYKLPKDSLFRGSNLDKLKKFGGSIKTGLEKHDLNFNMVKRIINDTADDMNILKQMIEENQDNLKTLQRTFYNTDLMTGVKEMRKFSREILANSPESQLSSNSKMAEVFVNKNMLSRKKELDMIKQNGFRPVMLQDIIKKPFLNDEGKLTLETLENAPIDLYDGLPHQSGNSMFYLQNIMENPYYKYLRNGKPTSIAGDWDNVKRMVVDKNILVDEQGKLIDLRMTNKIKTDFLKSLSTDFKIPGLDFNPLATLFPSWARGEVTPPTFGILSKNDYQPFITKSAGKVTVGEKFGSDILVFNGEGYRTVGNQLEKVADNIRLHDISRAGQFTFSKPIDSTRKMAGLEYYQYKTKNKGWAKKVDGLFQMADAGKSDVFDVKNSKNIRFNDIEDAKDFSGTANFEKRMSDKIKELSNKVNPYEKVIEEGEESAATVFGKGPSKIPKEFDEDEPTRRFIAAIKGTKFSDIKEEKGIMNKLDFTKKYMGEAFTAGRQKDGTMSDDFTEKTLRVFGLFDSVFERFGDIATPLAFSTKSKSSTFDYIKNVALKRVLPIYGLTQVPQMLNYLSEPIFQLLGMNEDDGTNNKMNINKFIASEIVKPVDIGLHNVKDMLGLTKVFKKIEEFTPGFDQIKELPGIYNLGVTQSKDERVDYIENGMDPVRKGRYWSMGNTPFTGGKITSWRPNSYRRAAADVDFSDSKWGSRQEYYNNTWYPNPVNPLAPLNHFILDRNHYDKKHYQDRPYLLTSTEGGNIPLIGPLVSSTIGSIGQSRMHNEYWQNGHPVERNDESVALLDYVKEATSYDRQAAANNSFINGGTLSSVNNNLQMATEGDTQSRNIAIVQSKQVTDTPLGTGFMSYSDFTGKELGSSNESNYEIYTTPSGGMQLVDIPDTLTTWDANKELQNYSIKRIPTADSRVDINDNKYNPQFADYSNEKINNSFVYGVGEEFNTLSDLFGMKGFEMQTFVTGKANQDAKVIEDSSYAYSFNKSFWDENLGGLGGEGSEIFRRFAQKRNTSTEYIDPIRNTMPSWMPGRNYFLDLKHGDPYSKLPNGEERLPGEGYERLYGIDTKKMFEMRIGSSYIGRTKEEMMKHLLNQDTMSSFGQQITEDGTKMHEKIEQQWVNSGLAISTEGKIEDKENKILGYYDALVHDMDSPTGVAMVDIKTVGQKKFNRIVAQGTPEYEHQSQVNYYLWSTGNTKSNGYIYYVNRDNPEQTATMGFKFSQDLLNENLNNLAEARNTISSQIQSGQIGRGELYNPIDRFRILADVAPYSDEFTQLKAILANDSQLSAEEQREISQIKERVTQQKEPLRLYPYKFKTSNLQSENVTVKKVIDNNTLLVDRYGVEHAIKFAGIHVSESDAENYNDSLTKKEAAAKEMKKYFRKGKRITINYDADEANKFKKDSVESIRAVVYSNGKNVNKQILNKGLATEKDDNSPAAIHARYSNNEILVGSAMETLTHFIGQIPFVGNKLLQVKSPYEQYRDREVYGKDFQSWEHPIRDFIKPQIDKISSMDGVGSVFMGAFIGSLFGKNKYGKIIGGAVGASIGAIGKVNAMAHKTHDKDWVPERREKQSELNEYFDTLKYIKNMSLYTKYRKKAILEDGVDVNDLEGSKLEKGIYNKNRSRELKDFKKTVKLDFKHRNDFNFEYGDPKYVDMKMDKKSIIGQINQELNEIQSDRSVERASDNVINALNYKQRAAQTMYGYEQGDPLNNLMVALPKKERQYLKHFMKAPEEEKDKILRIAPDYLRRGLQQAWGDDVDEKPTLQEYFEHHGLPEADWIGWNEDTDIENVKVKLVHNNKLDMGEFDLWNDQIDNANKTDIPIPKMHSQNSSSMIQSKLRNILGKVGYEEVAVAQYKTGGRNKNTLDVYQDSRDDISDKIYQMNI